MKKVLIFTYYWPPAGGVAVQRWLKFAKYLPEFGWEPIIVTVENGSYPYYDESLLKEVSSYARVYRTKTFEPFEIYNLLRGKKGKSVPTQTISDAKTKSLFQKLSEYVRANFFIPDARKGWVSYAIREAHKIIQNERIHAIVTSGPPHSSHQIAIKLQAKYRLPWIADFRDPWTEIFYNHYLPRTRYALKKDKLLEAEVLEKADVVIAISSGIKKMFESKSKRVEVLPNGFDVDDLPDFNTPIRNEKFVLGHIGSYVAALNSEGLWRAIRELKENVVGFREKFCLSFTGKVDVSIIDKIESFGIKDLMVFDNFVPHREAVKRMYSADLLLLVLANVPDNKYITSGKLFEYLASSTPILGIAATDGDANDILIAAERDAIVDYDDSSSIKTIIMKYYQDWETNNKRSRKIDVSNLKKFQRKEITRELSLLLNQISES